MLIEEAVLPVVAFTIGMLSLFTDRSASRRKWVIALLAFAFVATCALDIHFRHARRIEGDLNTAWLRSNIDDLRSLVREVGSRVGEVDSLVRVMRDFGYAEEPLARTTLGGFQESLLANAERSLAEIATVPQTRAQTRVQYFPKDVDGPRVLASLRELDFEVRPGITRVQSVPTNSLWFGIDVPIDNVKLVAYTLIRAGVAIKSIRPFRSGGGARSNLIQVGADALLADTPRLSVVEIRSASRFVRE